MAPSDHKALPRDVAGFWSFFCNETAGNCRDGLVAQRVGPISSPARSSCWILNPPLARLPRCCTVNWEIGYLLVPNLPSLVGRDCGCPQYDSPVNVQTVVGGHSFHGFLLVTCVINANTTAAYSCLRLFYELLRHCCGTIEMLQTGKLLFS
jgi:hypothetical protein